MYLQRQDTEHRLNAVDHDHLVAALEQIGREGLAEVVIEHFGKELSFQEQVARASTVDVSAIRQGMPCEAAHNQEVRADVRSLSRSMGMV
jgi:hypothetical protein